MEKKRQVTYKDSFKGYNVILHYHTHFLYEISSLWNHLVMFQSIFNLTDFHYYWPSNKIYTTQNLLRITFSFNDLMLKTNRLKKDFFCKDRLIFGLDDSVGNMSIRHVYYAQGSRCRSPLSQNATKK